MGIIKPGVLGETTGKVSNLIFYNVNGQLRVRKCPAKVRNPRSPKQTAQRTRVKGIADLYALLDDQIYYNWKALAEGTTANGYNLFMSHNIRELEEIMVVDETMVERSTGHYEWQVPEELAPAQAYGFFKGQYTNDVSGSFYLGELTKQGE